MNFDKDFILDEIRKHGRDEQLQKAVQELPEKIDHEQHAALLEKFGVDPGKLVASVAEQETASAAAARPGGGPMTGTASETPAEPPGSETDGDASDADRATIEQARQERNGQEPLS